MPLPSKFMIIDRGFLTIRVKPGYDYEINLDSINTRADMLRWRDHLSEKRWMTPYYLDEFCKLVAAQKPLK